MNLQQKAQTRNQIENISLMKQDLIKDFKIISMELEKINNLLNQKKYSKNKKLLNSQEIYTQNKLLIEYTLQVTNEVLNQLRLQEKPRAYFQITKKLI